MGFQDYKLPAQVVVDMYRSALVQGSAPVRTSSPETAPVTPSLPEAIAVKPDVAFKGKNTKSIAVIVACRQKMSETSAEITFLLKILKACNLGLDDIALIDVKSLSTELEEFVESFRPNRILLFSKSFNGSLLAPETCFEVRKIADAEVVYAPEVYEMQAEGNESVQLKKKLWLVLKNFFNV